MPRFAPQGQDLQMYLSRHSLQSALVASLQGHFGTHYLELDAEEIDDYTDGVRMSYFGEHEDKDDDEDEDDEDEDKDKNDDDDKNSDKIRVKVQPEDISLAKINITENDGIVLDI